MWKHTAVGQDQLERGRTIRRHLSAAQPGHPLDQPQEVRLGNGEIHEDRVDRRDRGEQCRLPFADEVASVDGDLADDPRDRRLHGGVPEVQVGLNHGGLARFDGRLGELNAGALTQDGVLEPGFSRLNPGSGRLLTRDGGVQVLLRNRLLLDQRTVARNVGLVLPEISLRLIELGARTIHDRGVLGASQVGLRFGELGAGRLQRRPVFVLLDHEQHLATLNLGALLEPHLLENALDSSPDLDGGNALRLGHELGGDLDAALLDLGDDDGGWGWGRGLLCCSGVSLLASGDRDQQGDAGQAAAPRRPGLRPSWRNQHGSGLPAQMGLHQFRGHTTPRRRGRLERTVVITASSEK